MVLARSGNRNGITQLGLTLHGLVREALMHRRVCEKLIMRGGDHSPERVQWKAGAVLRSLSAGDNEAERVLELLLLQGTRAHVADNGGPET